jgi:hypothetical protein
MVKGLKLDPEWEFVRPAIMLNKNGYPMFGGKLLHRWLLWATGNQVVDHRNRNILDCRLRNLRLATPQQNNANRKPWGKVRYKGVSFNKEKRKYEVGIKVDGKKMHIGIFSDVKKAALAYDAAALAVWGEFAFLNFPKKSRGIK